MLNKLDEKDFILVRKLFVAPTQIRNRFHLIMRNLQVSNGAEALFRTEIAWFASKIGQCRKDNISVWFWRIALFGWISNRTPRQLTWITIIVIYWYNLYQPKRSSRPRLVWVWPSIIWNNIRWPEVLFKIQSKGALRRNPSGILSYQLNFKCNSLNFCLAGSHHFRVTI